MDNASKALIMAGATLIAILIISLTMYMLNTFRQYSENASLITRSTQDEAFNRFFVFHNKKISWVDAYNLVQKAKDINENAHFADEIIVKYQGTSASDLDSTATQISNEGSNNVAKEYDYKFVYGTNGKIKEIQIYN